MTPCPEYKPTDLLQISSFQGQSLLLTPNEVEQNFADKKVKEYFGLSGKKSPQYPYSIKFAKQKINQNCKIFCNTI